ncbi:hypothetical protein TOPH_07336 [Tolypocladium ophioglossoides CBS 100239]|uniref:Uncharacterized protein n=1 Tax=Tolypocladium ophioglossoides (strain CBS 100239) TaxID=1163406 RepID=A0A0L0N1R0_TOLOC|nr:hypothetical protein TOPH_07336 [Tolypocladium ophioglossoides CBS 100239]
MDTPRSILLPDDGLEDDNERLYEFNTENFGDSFSISHRDVNSFEPITGRIYESYPTDRIVVFRPRKGKKMFGCIRVLERETAAQDEVTKKKKSPVWEEKRGGGPYVGLIPSECRFEAILVEIKFIMKR